MLSNIKKKFVASTIVFYTLLTASYIMFEVADAGLCEWWVGGCGGIPIENPGSASPSAAACMATCGGRTVCNPANPMQRYSCAYSY